MEGVLTYHLGHRVRARPRDRPTPRASLGEEG